MTTEQNYPGVSLRIKASVIDYFMIVVFMFLITWLFSFFENVPENARIFAFVFVFFLYDPIFTSFFGGTIGHFVFGLRVRRESNPNRKILFPLAILRFIFKASLGWVSLVTVHTNEKRKAIHDLIVGSLIIYAKQIEEINES